MKSLLRVIFGLGDVAAEPERFRDELQEAHRRLSGPVDVTHVEGPKVGAWEFSDPVMQTDADLRRQIGELTEENRSLRQQVSDLEMRVIFDEHQRAALHVEREFLAQARLDLQRRIELTESIRTATLRNQVAKLSGELARARRKAA